MVLAIDPLGNTIYIKPKHNTKYVIYCVYYHSQDKSLSAEEEQSVSSVPIIRGIRQISEKSKNPECKQIKCK